MPSPCLQSHHSRVPAYTLAAPREPSALQRWYLHYSPYKHLWMGGAQASFQAPACPQISVQPALACGQGCVHGGLCSENSQIGVAELVLTS